MKKWIKSDEYFSYDHLTGTIDTVIEHLEGIRAKLGPDVRIEIEIDEYDYGGGQYISAHLERVETDEEYKARLEKIAVDEANRKSMRKKMYDTLKKEFEE